MYVLLQQERTRYDWSPDNHVGRGVCIATLLCIRSRSVHDDKLTTTHATDVCTVAGKTYEA
jgi:hypothetical protein